jgi:hypothetical protein
MKEKKTLGLLSLIFGIAAIALIVFNNKTGNQFFAPLTFAGPALAVLGLVFSSIAKKKDGKGGLNIAGFIIALIALIFFIITVGLILFFIFGLGYFIGG